MSYSPVLEMFKLLVLLCLAFTTRQAAPYDWLSLKEMLGKVSKWVDVVATSSGSSFFYLLVCSQSIFPVPTIIKGFGELELILQTTAKLRR